MRRLLLFACFCLTVATTASAQLQPIQHALRGPMQTNDRELFDSAMKLMDASYDPQAHLVFRPHDVHASESNHYMVRESSWYALGLLMRDRAGDRPADAQRAIAILGTVLDQQYLNKNVKWYGTYKRSPEETGPKTGEIAFTTYDPNWRHFIGTTLQAILIEYPQALPEALKARMYASIDAAVAGEIHDGRLVPAYSNIALMYGALWDFAAVHDKNTDWSSRSAAWNDEVFRLFQQHGAFNEYNAPTYYGVDLYGLALWREYGSTALMREQGRTMETGLWNDIAQFYQPELRNITGPYDRAYGMDMTVYVTPTGVWMRSFLPAPKAPLPEHPTLDTFQVADLWYAPQVALLGTNVPAEALGKFRNFSGPHLVIRPIDNVRTATSWVGSDSIWGGEYTGRTKDTGNKTQFHPVDAQWRMPSGAIGWIQLTRSPNIDAVADREGVSMSADGDISFRVFTGDTPAELTANAWSLPGFNTTVASDAKDVSTAQPTNCKGCTEITYKGAHWLRLNFHTRPASATK